MYVSVFKPLLCDLVTAAVLPSLFRQLRSTAYKMKVVQAWTHRDEGPIKHVIPECVQSVLLKAQSHCFQTPVFVSVLKLFVHF